MELEEIKSDLLALRQLYGLLQTNGDGMQNMASENAGKLLDKRARHLLKNLLDFATERISRTHSKIIAAHLEVINTSIKPYPEKIIVPKLKPSFLPHEVKDFPISTQNSGKDLKRHTITLQNEEQTPKKPQHAISELSKVCVSYKKPESKQKQRQIGQESSIQKQASNKESKLFCKKARIPSKVGHQEQHNHSKRERGLIELNETALESVKGREKPRQKKTYGIVGNSSIVGSVGCTSASFTSASKRAATCGLTDHLGENKFSKEVSDAIIQIESEILALQLLDPINIGAPHPDLIKIDDSVSLVKHSIEGAVTISKISQGARSGCSGNETLFRHASQPTQKYENSNPAPTVSSHCGKTVLVRNNSSKGRLPVMDTSKQIIKYNDRLSQLANQMDKSGKVSGQKFKEQNQPNARTSPYFESKSQSESSDNQVRSYVHGLRVSLSHDDSSLSPAQQKKIHNQAIRESPVQNTKAPKGTTKKVVRSIPLLPPRPMVTSPVGPDDKLKPTRTRGLTMIENSSRRQVIIRPTLLKQKSNEAMVSPISHINEKEEQKGTYRKYCVSPRNKILQLRPASEDTSSSPSPLSSSSSWTTQTYTEGDEISEKRSLSYPERNRHRDVSSKRTYISRRQRNSKEAIGRFKRFKNKLGLIFHHHHHHHHHHDDGTVYHHNTWKHLKKIFHHTSKHDNHVDVAIGKFSRSAVTHKRRDGHVHGLVEGLLRHLRRSKKLDRHRSGIEGIGPNGRRKKVAKRFHWWQKVRSRGGMKLPKRRGRVKLGFTSKRPKLKMT